MVQWSKAHPAEYRAMRTEGAAVSGHKNLFDFRRTIKRKAPETARSEEGVLPTPPKVRRDDDTSDKAYLRRQALWERTSTGKLPASQALSAKQPVGEDGQPLKEEPTQTQAPSQSSGNPDPADPNRSGDSGQVKHEGLHNADTQEDRKRIKLQEDVQVSEGLRSPRWLWEALYPYQHTCVKWLWDLHGEQMGGILADEMGLGKTVQIAAYLGTLHHSGVLQNMRIQNTSLGAASPAKPGGVLIVCPATLVTQWRNELHIWYPPLRVCVMHQVSERERRESMEVAVREQGVLITSYETMRTAHDELLKHTWVMLILDEGQKIRNPHANITIATKQFSTPHRILLSGSPIQNNLQELWSLFDFICPGRLGTLPVFLEEFAEPIEKGNLVGANETKVAAAYQCAMALRELTQPCILRRTKADCMDILRLPHKQEQVLFCHLTPEQYQVYIEFLQTEQVRKAMVRNPDQRNNGAAFFSIGVLRKLCNHPDLLLRDADEKLKPKDMGNPERSGKMKVLAEIMRKWKEEGHRALIFVQTIQMLEILQSWMQSCEYTYLRIDGKTPVKKRLKLIEEFNGDTSLFSMILTTRVGGVGLNIIGADRVLIFDPDWNPMTDVQARERTWRIGQKRDVTIYRLVLTGTVEEKIYQRQVYKHFLSQKILNDPRQRQFFKWNDMADLFDVPPMPPNFSPEEMLTLKRKYQALFKKLKPEDSYGEEVETTELMHSITALPTKKENKASKAASSEHSELLKSLYSSNGIKASFNHDKVEQPLLDRRIIQKGASLIASRAVAAVQKSARERASHHISEPTWTGQRGRAGVSASAAKFEVVKHEGVKREMVKREIVNGCIVQHRVSSLEGGSSSSASGATGGLNYNTLKSSGVKPAHILDGLRQLAAIRSSASARDVSQSDEASKRGVSQLRLDANLGLTPDAPATPRPERSADAGLSEADLAQIEGDCVGLPIELHSSDRQIAERILSTFLDPKLAGIEHSLTTGQVLDQLAPQIAQHHADLFKSLLKQLCVHSKPSRPGQPAIWTLKPEFWPKKSERS
uniref:DNA excision repair protein ERCC-6 n=1 Tax=Crypthecodinium cohnii TaxID=2866 RepID=A0A516AGM2_CRYCO|nr:DNA excision repair protein ERCC-6 [Crypthecodinium cohnii]USW07847.1 DNA excision repair protein ERCC-6 [Crypthecodinium cohnii]